MTTSIVQNMHIAPRQLSLPLFDPSPICPACKQPAPVLGQWSPDLSVFICHQCMTDYGIDPSVFVPSNNSIGIALRQGSAFEALRSQYHERGSVLLELKHGCVYTLATVEDDYLPCMRDNDLYLIAHYGGGGLGWHRPVIVDMRHDCARCKDRLRKVSRQREDRLHFGDRIRAKSLNYTHSLPICLACGRTHDRRLKSGEFAPYCQPCQDSKTINALWQNKGIFDVPDPEDVLDKLVLSHPELFERGVLPDAWIVLARAA